MDTSTPITTIEELVKLALKATSIAEADAWIEWLLTNHHGQRCLFHLPLKSENVLALGHSISLAIFRSLPASDNGLEQKGHRFLEEVRMLAAENGVYVKKIDNISGLKYSFSSA